MVGNDVEIIEKSRQGDIIYKDEDILSYTLKYPEFLAKEELSYKHKEPECSDADLNQFLKHLNVYYKIKTIMYEKNNIRNLNRMAIDDYENSIANEYPIRKYEAYTDYTITLNENCILSLYFDQYEYTGGAHGITHRTADSWDLIRGNRIVLSDLFADMDNYQEYIIQTILKQIEDAISSGNNIYFENYEELVKEHFNSNNFYLSEEGIVIYFDLYDIAPYASGMPTFIIPYS